METTLNIDIAVLSEITAAAQARGISRSVMIINLIKEIMNEIPDLSRLGRMVQYQERKGKDNWHTFHLYLREDDYEYFLDLRKLFKMSVSLILAFAVKKFLKRQIEANNTDNYTFKNYIVIREHIDGVISWRFLWGWPRNLKKILPHSSLDTV
ncbi:MAG: hypothetical protein JW807_16165 [Spirochaetes bacterium]|nr:hypothetical protein [Spirochaetota bacterium]